MDQHRALGLHAGKARLRTRQRRDQQIGRALAIGVGEQLDIVLGRPLHRVEHLFGIGRGIARIALGIVADRIVIGLVAPRGEALRTAVDGELGPGDADAAGVGLALVGLDVVAVDQHVGIDHDVDRQPALRADFADHVGNHRRRAPFLRGGVAEPRPQLGAFAHEGLEPLGPGVLEHHRDGGEEGGLLQRAVGFGGAGLALDHPAFGILAVGGDAHQFEHLGIDRADMRRLVDHQHRKFGRDLIELFPGGMALFRQRGIVVAEADDHLALGNNVRVGGLPFLERPDHRGDIGHIAIGRGEHVGRQRLQPADEHMAVGIDEAGQQGAALEIDHLRALALELHHLFTGADGDDLAVILGNRLGAHGIVFHGDDRPANPDPVGGLSQCGGAGRQQQRSGGKMQNTHDVTP